MTIHHPNPDQKSWSNTPLKRGARQAFDAGANPTEETQHRQQPQDNGSAMSSGTRVLPHDAHAPGNCHKTGADRVDSERLGLQYPSAPAGTTSPGLLEDLCLAIGRDETQVPSQDSPFFFPAFEDPATAVALSVRFARKARRHRIPMAPPVLSLLDFHADQGDASCLAVRAWLARIGLVRAGSSGRRPATDARGLPRNDEVAERGQEVSA